MRQVQTRSMDDIGIGIPHLMPLPVDEEILQELLRYAGISRSEGLRMARHEIKKDRGATLRIILTVLKTLSIPRTEEFLASDKVQSKKIACGAGCSHCCHQNVEVSIPEAILVSLQVSDPDDSRRATILETADAIAHLKQDTRFVCGRPCPLLVDHKCSVYDNRPLLCRATLSPFAQGCRDALEGNAATLQIYTLPQFVALADKDALRGVCKDLGLQYDNVDLVQTVAAILRDPSTIVRWAQGEKVFKALQQAPPVP
jgi:Fe-S-cluster containining protein